MKAVEGLKINANLLDRTRGLKKMATTVATEERGEYRDVISGLKRRLDYFKTPRMCCSRGLVGSKKQENNKRTPIKEEIHLK